MSRIIMGRDEDGEEVEVRVTPEGILDFSSDDFDPITKSDETVLERKTRGVYVGVGGNVTVTNKRGVAVLWPNCPAGALMPIKTTKVLETGTTASGFVGVW